MTINAILISNIVDLLNSKLNRSCDWFWVLTESGFRSGVSGGLNLGVVTVIMSRARPLIYSFYQDSISSFLFSFLYLSNYFKRVPSQFASKIN